MTWQKTCLDCQRRRGHQRRRNLYETMTRRCVFSSGRASLFCLTTTWFELKRSDLDALTRPPAVWIGVTRRAQTIPIWGDFGWINHQPLHVKHLKDQLQPTKAKQAIKCFLFFSHKSLILPSWSLSQCNTALSHFAVTLFNGLLKNFSEWSTSEHRIF